MEIMTSYIKCYSSIGYRSSTCTKQQVLLNLVTIKGNGSILKINDAILFYYIMSGVLQQSYAVRPT